MRRTRLLLASMVTSGRPQHSGAGLQAVRPPSSRTRASIVSTRRVQRLKLGVPLWSVADRFDVIAVGIEHESAVVGSVILRPEPRPPVLTRACRYCCVVKGIHGCAVGAGERDIMDGGAEHTLLDPEIIRLARVSKPYSGDAVLHNQLVTERGQINHTPQTSASSTSSSGSSWPSVVKKRTFGYLSVCTVEE
jgi:hypothetical protein